MHLYYSLSQSFSSFPVSELLSDRLLGYVWETVRACTYSYTTINLIKLIKLIYTYKSKIQNCIIADDVTAGFTSSVPLSDRKYVTLNDNSFILDTRLVY